MIFFEFSMLFKVSQEFHFEKGNGRLEYYLMNWNFTKPCTDGDMSLTLL